MKIARLIERIGAKEWFSLLVLMVLFVNLIMFLDMPFLRQIFAFLYFTIIPGFLILQIVKLNKIDFLKKIVLSVGLSIAFLMFFGLLINQVYLVSGYFKPLSTPSLAISFTVILLILSFTAYKRNKDDFTLSDILNIRTDMGESQLISPLFIPILFPFLAVFGTYLMNTTADNTVLMIMLFLIPIYIVSIIWLRNKIHRATYPVAIYTIALALLLMHGLTSNYLNGRDVHMEYYAFRVVASNLHWSISNFHHVLTACLSTSLLPAIYWSLLDIDKLYVYKVIYQGIWAVTPLVCYVLFKKYVGELYAFLASLFFIFQMSFIFDLQSAMRTELAILFFALAMMVFFDNEIDKLNKKILFLIFMFSGVVSHYSVSYIFFFLMLSLWMTSVFVKKFSKIKFRYDISWTIIALFFSTIVLWYCQITHIAFIQGVGFLRETFMNLGKFFVEDIRAQGTYTFSSENLETPAHAISFIVLWTTFIFIGIGVFDSIKVYCHKKTSFEIEYLIMALISGGTLVAFLILPYVSEGYGNTRVYQQLLVILAIGFVMGGRALGRYIHRQNYDLVIIMIILISQFFCASFVIHQIFGVPYSEDLNRAGNRYGEYYIHNQEVISTEWLNMYNTNNLVICIDKASNSRLLMGCEVGRTPNVDSRFFRENKTINGEYIYLRNENVANRTVRVGSYFKDVAPLSDYSYLFRGKSKIYNNGGSEIWKC